MSGKLRQSHGVEGHDAVTLYIERHICVRFKFPCLRTDQRCKILKQLLHVTCIYRRLCAYAKAVSHKLQITLALKRQRRQLQA